MYFYCLSVVPMRCAWVNGDKSVGILSCRLRRVELVVGFAAFSSPGGAASFPSLGDHYCSGASRSLADADVPRWLRVSLERSVHASVSFLSCFVPRRSHHVELSLSCCEKCPLLCCDCVASDRFFLFSFFSRAWCPQYTGQRALFFVLGI